MTRMIGYFQAMLSHAESNDRHGYLWTLTNMLRLVCIMANEVELAPILSAACSLKHATDMKKTFSTQNEAFDKAKQLGLTPDLRSLVCQGVSGLLEIPTDSCHFFCTPANPCATPIVTRGEGSFSYQGVSTRGVRHSPVLWNYLCLWFFFSLPTSP